MPETKETQYSPEQEKIERLKLQWNVLTQEFGVEVNVSEGAFSDLVARYSGKDRFYHNLDHLINCFDIIESVKNKIENPSAVEFAVWFHDAIYNVRAKDNEELSASHAKKVMEEMNIPPNIIQRVEELILATKNHQLPKEEDKDCAIFLDADLSVFGLDEADFDRYSEAMRREYAWLSDQEYKTKRKEALLSYLQRERIYLTDEMFARFEEKARRNIQRVLNK